MYAIRSYYARRHRRLIPGVLLFAFAAAGGCDCDSTRSVTPNPLPPLSAVVVSPGADTLRVGEVRQFSAVALDTLGQPVAGAGFQWTSGDPSVFTVTPGVITSYSIHYTKLYEVDDPCRMRAGRS